MSLHADAVALLDGWAAPDPAQERLRTEYAAWLRARPDALSRSCEPDHLTASALVVSADRRSVLLTLHAKAGRWFQLGGHCEPADTTLAGAALREAREESGIDEVTVDPVPLHLDAHPVPFCGGRAGTRHLDVRFLATTPAGAQPVRTAESVEVRWWPVADLPTQERSVLDLVHRAVERLGVDAPPGVALRSG